MNKRISILWGMLLILTACSMPFDFFIPSENLEAIPDEENKPLVEFLQPKPTRTPTPTVSNRLAEADKALFSGDIDRALQLYQQAFEQSDDEEQKSQALYGLGRCFFTHREYNSAIDAFNRILGQYPNAEILPAPILWLEKAI